MAVGLPSQVIEPDRGELTALGAAGGELGRDDLVVSPDAGRRGRGVDPGRDRHLAAGRAARARCPGWPGWPAWAGGWWSGCSASRSAGSSPPGLTWLFGAPGAALIYCVAGALIALPERAWHDPAAGPGDPGRDGPVPGRDGGAAGLAGPRVLAGDLPRPAGHAGRHDPAHGADAAARFPGRPGSARFTAFDEAHGFAVNLFAVVALAVDRRRVPDRAAAAGPPGRHRASRCCAWRTGC